MRIGNVEIKNNIALAPMAGVTDLPFRLLCKEQGCGLMCTEMVSAKAVLYNNKNTEDLMKTVPGERLHQVFCILIVIQHCFGADHLCTHKPTSLLLA